MTAVELLTALRRRDVEVVVDENGLVCRGVIPDDLKAAIRANKDALSALVRDEGVTAPDTTPEVDGWPDDVQRLYAHRRDQLIASGASAPKATERTFHELRTAAFKQLISRSIADDLGIDVDTFVALSKGVVGRPGPATREQDVQIAAALLRRGGAR